jgi:histidyl-tRNA synthetase
MIRIRDTKHESTSDFLSSAIAVAEYYGFVHSDSIPPREKVKDEKRVATSQGDINYARKDERSFASSARSCISLGDAGRTLLMWRMGNQKGGERPTAVTLELHVVGTSLPIAEALLIVVSDAIAHEAGIATRSLALNSIGTTESSNRFVRDTGTFLRKHIESIVPALRPRAASDPLGTLVQLIERSHPSVSRAPQSVEYLIEEERRRFWEVIEYLETVELPYEIKSHLLGSRECWSHTLFQLSATDPETGAEIPLAFGGRYDPLALRISGRPVPAAVTTITCELRGKTRPQDRKKTAPRLYFAHLGTEARRRTLRVLELLRRESIPVHQSLLLERMSEQMHAAKKLSLPHMLIMGHKEAMEGTVLVRENLTNAQEAVPIEELVSYLRRHRIAVAQ